MKTYRMFTEDYVDSYALHRTSTGPGMGQYVPTANLNASTKEYGKSLEKIAKDRALKALSRKDRETLMKIANMLDKERKNFSRRKEEVKITESPLQMKHGDAIDLVLDKIKDVIRKDLERGKVDSLNKLGKMVKVKASGIDNKPGRHVVTLNQEFTMDEREDTTTKE
jgi:hypothetical protein